MKAMTAIKISYRRARVANACFCHDELRFREQQRNGEKGKYGDRRSRKRNENLPRRPRSHATGNLFPQNSIGLERTRKKRRARSVARRDAFLPLFFFQLSSTHPITPAASSSCALAFILDHRNRQFQIPIRYLKRTKSARAIAISFNSLGWHSNTRHWTGQCSSSQGTRTASSDPLGTWQHFPSLVRDIACVHSIIIRVILKRHKLTTPALLDCSFLGRCAL